jgi:hypothetical protein
MVYLFCLKKIPQHRTFIPSPVRPRHPLPLARHGTRNRKPIQTSSEKIASKNTHSDPNPARPPPLALALAGDLDASLNPSRRSAPFALDRAAALGSRSHRNPSPLPTLSDLAMAERKLDRPAALGKGEPPDLRTPSGCRSDLQRPRIGLGQICDWLVRASDLMRVVVAQMGCRLGSRRTGPPSWASSTILKVRTRNHKIFYLLTLLQFDFVLSYRGYTVARFAFNLCSL